ncbi:MAG: hypothetical protein U9Q15_03105 [Patescibacteria group bacterium]|nr:hypothetical protein [Patescibacteria group bacterium]
MTIDIIVTTVFVIGSIIVSSLLFSLTTQQLIIHILIASGLFWSVVIATGGK